MVLNFQPKSLLQLPVEHKETPKLKRFCWEIKPRLLGGWVILQQILSN